MTSLNYDNFSTDEGARIREEEIRLQRKRKNLKLRSHPIVTLQNFGFIALRALHKVVVYIVSHPFTVFLLVPTALAYILASRFEGGHLVYLDDLSLNIQFVIWWFFLGVVSSVGLGSGMHTGELSRVDIE